MNLQIVNAKARVVGWGLVTPQGATMRRSPPEILVGERPRDLVAIYRMEPELTRFSLAAARTMTVDL